MRIDVEIDPAEVLDDLTDNELQAYGLIREDVDRSDLAKDLQTLVNEMHDDEHEGPRMYCSHPLCARAQRGTDGFEHN